MKENYRLNCETYIEALRQLVLKIINKLNQMKYITKRVHFENSGWNDHKDIKFKAVHVQSWYKKVFVIFEGNEKDYCLRK